MGLRIFHERFESRLGKENGPLWKVERSLRRILERWPDDAVEVAHDWIMSQPDRLRVCDLLGIVVVNWSVSFYTPEQARLVAVQISDLLEDWRLEILEQPDPYKDHRRDGRNYDD